MWNRKRTAVYALVALATWACSPEAYPTESRFEPPPEVIEIPDGELFFYEPPAGVSVNSVSLRGSFNEWGETPMIELPDGRWVAGVELEPGEYMYKYFFNGTAWAASMCNDPTYGDPDDGFKVDAAVVECTGGGDGIRQVGTPVPAGHTFLYIVPENVDVEVVTVQGSFQDPVWQQDADTLTNIWELTVDVAAGTYNYKYLFNGPNGWVGSMCDDANWGDSANGNRVDPDNEEACTGGGDGTLTIDEAGPHTFRYIVPAGVDSIASISVAGSFQDPVWQADVDFMTETFQRRYDLEPATYQYKFRFDGNWAGNMCAEGTWAAGGMADANGEGCVEGGDDAEITIE